MLFDSSAIKKGDLDQLRSTKGDFTTTIITCLDNDGTDNQSMDAEDPSGAGQGFYYLVRAVNCTTIGSYNTGDSKQVVDRDAEIEASGNKCP